MMAFIKEFILNSSLKNSNQKNKQFMPWDKIKSVALITDPKCMDSKNELDGFIYKSDKLIDVYFIDINTKESSVKDYISFSTKEKTIFGLPNSKALAKLQNKEYDLLINVSFHQADFASVIANTVNSRCKCGAEAKKNELDLIIKRKENSNLLAYLNEVMNYLKMIRN